jgi:hypothetical protein
LIAGATAHTWRFVPGSDCRVSVPHFGSAALWQPIRVAAAMINKPLMLRIVVIRFILEAGACAIVL